MPLPTSGNAITFSQIRTEFSRSNPVNLGDYRGITSGVPSSGSISLSSHLGGKSAVALTPTFTYSDYGQAPPTPSNLIISGSADDTSISLPATSHDFYFNGVNYGKGLNGGIYVGSNSYITFGGGSSVYSGLTVSNPARPHIQIGSGDRSWQRLYTYDYGTFTSIRFEGTLGTSGTVGSPNIVWYAELYANGNILLILAQNKSGNFWISNGSTGRTFPTIPAYTYVRCDISGTTNTFT